MKRVKIAHPPYISLLKETPFWYNLVLPFSERRLLLFLGDLSVVFLAGWLAFLVWWYLYPEVAYMPTFFRVQIQWLGILSTGWFVLLIVDEGYDLKITLQLPQIIRILLSSAFILAFFYLLIFFVGGRIPWKLIFQTPEMSGVIIPRIAPTVFLIIVPILTFVWRAIYAGAFSSSLLRRRMLIVGSGYAGRSFVQAMHHEAIEIDIVGFVDDDPEKQNQLIEDTPVLGTHIDLIRLIHQLKISEVVLAITNGIHSELFQALVDCYELGVDIRPMPAVYEELLGRVPVEHLGQKWFFAPMWHSRGLPTFYRISKRLLDIGLALIGLSMFSVILPFLALMMYLDSPGPIFYSQERVGRKGSRFNIYKLRSMIPDAEKSGKAVWATQNDPRITRVGQFLRKTRLDEIPQLLNVLRGEMSMIGPRPERPHFTKRLQQEIPFYQTRHSVKPGLTGWAQIKYHYGNTVDDALIKLQYDLYYIRHQSIILDTLIALRTIKVMLTFKGT